MFAPRGRRCRVALSLVLFAASVFVIGSGIAAIPYAENDPCLSGSETLDSRWAMQAVPYGTRCEFETAGGPIEVRELAPSIGIAVAWWLATALVLAAALRFRRHASARGVALALLVLGVFGVLSHQWEFTGAALFTVVYGVPLSLVAAWLLQPGRGLLSPAVLSVTLPFTTLCVWFVPSGFEFDEVGVVLALLAGAGLAAIVERLLAMCARSSHASRPQPG